MLFTMLPISAWAAANEINITLIDYPRGGGSSSTEWGHGALNFMNGWSMNETNKFPAKAVSETMDVAYCLQPGVSLSNNSTLSASDFENFYRTYSTSQMSASYIDAYIGRILLYGYTGKIGLNDSDDVLAHQLATQLLIWECITGERDRYFNKVAPSAGYNEVREFIAEAHPLRSLIFSYYDGMVQQVQEHMKRPSFMSEDVSVSDTVSLKWDGSSYSVVLTDTNNVLGNYTFSASTDGIGFDVTGNQLKISAAAPPSESFTITATKGNSNSRAVLYWANGDITNKDNEQAVTVAGEPISDPIYAFLNAEVSTGNLVIEKTSENNNGIVSGFTFDILDNTGSIYGSYTTPENGRKIIQNMPSGVYTVRETNISSEFVEPDNNIEVTVYAGQTSTVNFNNIRKQGVISVQKTNGNPQMGDYSLAGAEFAVYDSDGRLKDTITTDSFGMGYSDPLPIADGGTAYKVIETKAPYGFTVNTEEFYVTLTGSLGSEAIVYSPVIQVVEMPQTGKITIIKYDSETASTPQGNAALTDLAVDLYDADYNLLETLYFGDNTTATSSELPLGDYYYKERIPPNGYLLDNEYHPISLTYAGQEISITSSSGTIENDVIKGRIYLTKHTDGLDTNVEPPNSGIEKPLPDVQFRIYLKSAGNYESAKMSERDIITTGLNGIAVSKLLPFGTYVVEEMECEANEGKLLVAPFDVIISEHERTYYYILNDSSIVQPLKIIKTDGENNIPIPDEAAFKIYDIDNDCFVEQEIYYPNPEKISVFKTENGFVQLPEKLNYGRYALIEVEAPTGYAINSEPIYFEVNNQIGELITITVSNMPVKGHVEIYKEGPILTGAELTETEYGTLYTPVYENGPLSGARFDVYAAQDIRTATELKYSKDEYVGSLITENGVASFDGLYLGKYYLIEASPPDEYLQSPDKYYFELSYEGQTISEVSAELRIENERQPICIEINKTFETPANAPEGFNPYSDVLFGVFSRSDILDASGKVIIPTDSLLTTISIDGTGFGYVCQQLPFADMYVKELTTNEAYILDDHEYDISPVYSNGESQHTVRVNNGDAIVNRLIKGRLELLKVNENGTPLSGAVFAVYQYINDDTDYSLLEPLYTITTDASGMAYAEFDYGRYRIVEVKAPNSFELDSTPYDFDIQEDGQIITLTFTNKIKEVTENPKTGTGESNVIMTITALACGSLSVMLISQIISRRKRKNGK